MAIEGSQRVLSVVHDKRKFARHTFFCFSYRWTELFTLKGRFVKSGMDRYEIAKRLKRV